MTRVTVLLLAIIASGCAYGVSFEDCQLTCLVPADCPDGFDCRENLCRAGGATGACMGSAPVTLRQTTDDKVDRNLVFACTNADGTTAETSWYRVFSLAEAVVTSPFHVDHVTLGICFAVGNPIVLVTLGTYAGSLQDTELNLGKIAPLKMVTAQIPPTQITELVTIPITGVIAPNDLAIVEVRVTDQNGTGQQVNIGSTDSGQSHPAYFRTPLCGTNVPTNTIGAGHPDARFVLTVTGTR